MKALIIVDYEKEWITPDSEENVGDIDTEIANVNKLLAYARSKEWKIVFTTHIEADSDSAFTGERAEIIDSVDRQDSDVLIKKNKVSAFYKTELGKELTGVDSIVVAGILTNLCVRSLVEGAYDRDLDITVVKDACVASDKETQEFTFKDLKATREEIEFVDTEDFLNG